MQGNLATLKYVINYEMGNRSMQDSSTIIQKISCNYCCTMKSNQRLKAKVINNFLSFFSVYMFNFGPVTNWRSVLCVFHLSPFRSCSQWRIEYIHYSGDGGDQHRKNRAAILLSIQCSQKYHFRWYTTEIGRRDKQCKSTVKEIHVGSAESYTVIMWLWLLISCFYQCSLVHTHY